MDVDKAISIAEECGFEWVKPLDPSKLEFRQDVRDMCNPELCTQGYDKSWSCPPVAPALEDLRARADGYTQGILVQTTGQLEDEFDFETVYELALQHAKNFKPFAEKMRAEAGGDALPLGAGSCSYCPSCSYPDEPCRYPDKMVTSMESSGLLVNKVCEDNGLPYNHGKNTMTYTSCCLF